jgi:hypothetical protein
MTKTDWREATGHRSAEKIFFTQPVPDHLQINDRTLRRAKQAPIIAVDIEASNKRPQAQDYAAISKWGLSIMADITAIGIAFSDRHNDGVVLLAPFDDEETQFVRDIFTREDVLILFHNGQYDMRGLGVHLGMPIPRNVWDTHTAAMTMGVEDRKYSSLDEQCLAYEQVILGDVDYTVDNPEHDDYGREYSDQWTNWHRYRHIKSQRSDLDALPPHQLAWYVLEDARLTYKLYRAQREWTEILIHDYGYTALPELHDIDQRYTWVTYHWTVDGMEVDRDYIKRQLERISNKKFEMELHLAKVGVGQLTTYEGKVRFYFDHSGVPRPDPTALDQKHLFTKTGKFSFSETAMEYYKEVYPAETSWFQYYQHLTKTETTLISYLAHSMLDGRIHPMIGIGAITGRSTSSHPNTLNVSVKLPDEVVVEMEDVLKLSGRGCVRGSLGHCLYELDYQAAEKRAQAVESGEVRLAEMFRDGEDMHTVFGRIYFGEEWAAYEAMLANPDATEEQRQAAKDGIKKLRTKGKPLTFGRDYGMGAKKAARRMKITEEEARQLIARFDSEFWRLANWKRRVQDDAERSFERMKECPNPLFAHGFVQNAFGQRILISNPSWNEEEQRQRTYWYKGTNYVPQSFVAVAVKKAVWSIYWGFKKAKLRSKMQQQYHDAIILDADPDEIEEAASIAAWAMSTAVPYNISTVEDIYVEWPAGLDHADNSVKWGFIDQEDYPHATHDENHKPAVIEADPAAVLDHLVGQYRVEGKRATDDWKARFKVALESGPQSDPEAYTLWVHADNSMEWVRWKDVPRSFSELKRVAQTLYAMLNYHNSISTEYVPLVKGYIDFVDWAVAERERIKYAQRRYRQLMEAIDERTEQHQVTA